MLTFIFFCTWLSLLSLIGLSWHPCWISLGSACVYFWDRYSIPFPLFIYLYACQGLYIYIYNVSNYHGFGFKIRKHESCNSFFFFLDTFGYTRSFKIPYKFLYFWKKKLIVTLMAITLNTLTGLGKITILKNIILQSINRDVLPIAYVLFNFLQNWF